MKPEYSAIFSTSASCFNIVESVIDAPQIQKTLWKMKQKAGNGILFIMWSLSIWLYTGRMDIVWFLLLVIVEPTMVNLASTKS